MADLRTPFSCRTGFAESSWYRSSIRIVVCSNSSGIITVRARLIGVKMRKRRYGVRIIPKVRCGVVWVRSSGRGAGKRNFRASVEASSTGIMNRERMGISTTIGMSVQFRPLDTFAVIKVTEAFPRKLPNEERDNTQESYTTCNGETNN